MKNFVAILGFICVGMLLFVWEASPSEAQSAPNAVVLYNDDSVLSWQYTRNTSVELEIERSSDGGYSWTHMESQRAETSGYYYFPDASRLCGLNYLYRVRAHRLTDNVYSAYSNTISIAAFPCASPLSEEVCSFTPFLNAGAEDLSSMYLSGNGSRAFLNYSRLAQNWLEIYDMGTSSQIQTVQAVAATEISDDGSRFAYVETNSINNFSQLKRWTNGTVETVLEVSRIDSISMNGDGTKIAFLAIEHLYETRQLFLWEEGLGYFAITLPNHHIEMARLSGDGNSIAILGYNQSAYMETLFRWDTVNGMVSLTDLTIERGTFYVWYQYNAFSINDDGSSISLGYLQPDSPYSNILYTWREDEGLLDLLQFQSGWNSSNSYRKIPSAWTGDGNRLLFLTDDDLTGENPDLSLEYFFLDGRAIRQITTNAEFGYALSSVTMSNDGTKILAVTSSPAPIDTATDALSDFRLMVGTCAAASEAPSPLNAVTDLSANAIGENQVDLSWTDNNSDESYYILEVYYRGLWELVDALPADTSSYSYHYSEGFCGYEFQLRIRAYRETDTVYSDRSNVARARSSSCETLNEPNDVTATNLAEGSIRIDWEDNNGDETSYVIERMVGSQEASSSGSSTGTVTSSTGGGATTGSTATSGATSLSTSGTSTGSSGSSGGTTSGSGTSGMSLSAESSSDTSRGGGMSGGDLLWGPDSAGTWYVVGEVAANSTSFIDNTVLCGTTYSYRVRAYRQSDDSISDEGKSVLLTNTSCAFHTPRNLDVVAATVSSISLEWDDIWTSETSIYLERSLRGSSTWTQIAVLPTNSSSYLDTGLLCEMDYRYRIRAYRAADNLFSSSLTIDSARTSDCSSVGAPSNLLVSGNSPTAISLSWTDTATDETGFLLERQNGNSTTAAWVSVVTLPANSASYSDSSGLGCGYAYRYRVRALRENNRTATSNVVTGYLQCSAPNAASNLLLTSQSSNSIGFKWTLTNVYSSQVIERSSDGGTSWTALPSINSGDDEYLDTGLACDTSYQYRIRAYREFDNSYSAYSPVLTASTLICPGFNAPSNFMMTGNGSTSIALSWQDNNSDETGFALEISTDDVNWSLVASLPADTTSYDVTGLSCTSDYYFRIRAARGTLYSAYTAILLAGTGECSPLAAPTNLSISTSSNHVLGLSWTDNEIDESFYQLERSLDGISWTNIGFLPVNSSSYQNTGLECNTSYQYRVRAYRFRDDSYSAYANIVTGTTTSCMLNASLVLSFTSSTTSSVSLSWIDSAIDETAFSIERSDTGVGGWTVVTETAANSTSYTHTAMACNKAYRYRIRAYRSGDNSYSAYSNLVTISCPAPTAPTNLSATPDTATTAVFLYFTDTSNSESSFYIEQHSGDGNWIRVWQTNANSSNTVMTGLVCAQTYYFRMRAYRAYDNQYSPYSNEVSATVRACSIKAPTGLTITGSTANSLTMVWGDTNLDETGYRLERSTNGASWTQIAELPVDASEYTDSGLSCGGYFYRVRAYRGASTLSTYSNVVYGVAECPALTAPFDLSASGINFTATLNWLDSNDTESGFRLEESDNGGATWKEIAQPTTLSYSRSMQLCGMSYQYRVRAFRNADSSNSPYSNVVEVQSPLCPPLTPTNLTITDNSGGNVTLNWEDNAADETNYRIERSVNSGSSYSEIAQADANSTSFNDTGSSCSTYRYRVRAYREVDNQYSAYSNVVYLTCPPPDAPTNLVQTGSTNTSITLGWTDTATETSYRVERSSNNGTTWTLLTSPGQNVTTYTNSSLSCGSTYQYRVRAYRSSDAVYSAYSNVLTASSSPCPPTAPSSLTITDNSGGNITLNWLDNASNESGYRVERSTNAGTSWTEVAQLAAGSTSYSDSGVICSQYRYRVRAVTAANVYSSYSNTASLSTCPVPAAPGNLRATNVTAYWLYFAWDDNSSDETHFMIERSTNGGTSWVLINTLWGDTTSHSHGIACNTSYLYRMRAYRSTDIKYSDYSNTISFTSGACLNAPTNLLSTAQTSSSISLTWTDTNSNESSYRLERSTNGTTFTEIAQLLPNSSSYTDSARNCGTNYWYRVRAYRFSDNYFAEYSNTVSVSTNPCVMLIAPTAFVLTGSGYSSLSFSWRDNSTNESGYEIERSLDGTNWQILASLPADSTSYTDSNLDCQTGYRYRLRSLHLGNGTYSAYGLANYLTQPCPALVASSLSSTGSTVNSLGLSWTVDSTATSFTLSYNQNGMWRNLGTFGRDVTSFSHSGLACGQTYQYRIQTFRRPDNATVSSGIFSSSTSACPALAAPAAPVVLNADVAIVSLQLPAMPSGATSMSLERSTDGVNWSGMGTVSANYFDTTVLCGTSYHYRLLAYRASDGQYSPASPVAFAITLACPVAVSNLVGVYRNGQWIFVDSNDTATPSSSFNFGDGQWQAIVGDWDGDGADGLGLYRNGEFILRNNAGGTITENRFNFGDGTAGWLPVGGDWNGDGIDTIGIYKDGLFIISEDNLNQNYRFNFGDGTAGWRPVAGDWDGNGADGIGLYKNGVWYLAGSVVNPGSTMQNIAYGPNQDGWLPVAGDWNGDGIDTIGLYKDGLWRIRLSSNTSGDEIALFFGQAGDIPLSIYEGTAEELVAFGMMITSPEFPPVAEPTEEAPTEAPVIEPEAQQTPIAPVIEPEITPEVTAEPQG